VLARPQHRLGRPHRRRLALVALLSRFIAQQQPPELLVVHCAGSMQIAVSRGLAVWTSSANLEAQALARGWHTLHAGKLHHSCATSFRHGQRLPTPTSLARRIYCAVTGRVNPQRLRSMLRRNMHGQVLTLGPLIPPSASTNARLTYHDPRRPTERLNNVHSEMLHSDGMITRSSVPHIAAPAVSSGLRLARFLHLSFPSLPAQPLNIYSHPTRCNQYSFPLARPNFLCNTAQPPRCPSCCLLQPLLLLVCASTTRPRRTSLPLLPTQF
jgi:hypothetical protein